MTQRPRHLRPSDLRSAAQLLTQAVTGVTRIVEGVHQSVWGTVGVPGGSEAGRSRGLTGMVYRSVEGVTRLAGQGVDSVLARLLPAASESGVPETPQRAAFLAALNGVIGDRLAATGNLLATPMTLRAQGEPLDLRAVPLLPDAKGRILLLVHGLCMNDLQWRTTHGGQAGDHGTVLAAAMGATPLYLRYNTGQPVATNGRELSALLGQLVACWPVPVQDLTIVAHSMGGLVARSAVLQAAQQNMRWRSQLASIVFLGTPHHGAPLERAGSWVDVLLGATPWTAPFKRIGQSRSAGITDLRYGHVRDEDGAGRDRFRRQPDRRMPTPLPERVACYTIAATLAGKRGALADRLIGDGLVPLPSALGQHEDPQHALDFGAQAQWIAYRTGHLELLSKPDVAAQMLRWLAPASGTGEPGQPQPARAAFHGRRL